MVQGSRDQGRLQDGIEERTRLFTAVMVSPLSCDNTACLPMLRPRSLVKLCMNRSVPHLLLTSQKKQATLGCCCDTDSPDSTYSRRSLRIVRTG